METTKVLILGGTGMLGHRLFFYLAEAPGLDVYATIRRGGDHVLQFPETLRNKIMTNIDVANDDLLAGCIGELQPDIIVNCIGIIKQSPLAGDYLQAIGLNALLPHRITRYAQSTGARLIQISTDCVFDGTRGYYGEADSPTPVDLYGRSKLLGEVDYGNHITIRTSMIGHELQSHHGLLEWFLQQAGPVPGYTRCIFSGFPTVELARIIQDFVIPHPELQGIYHIAAQPITKHDLLRLIAAAYNSPATILPEAGPAVDRSLNPGRFRESTGYQAPSWQQLIQTMHRDYQTTYCYLGK